MLHGCFDIGYIARRGDNDDVGVGFLPESTGDLEAVCVGQVEVQEVRLLHKLARVPAGELTRIPVQLTSLVRFRPQAKLNPYLGLGIGYASIDFDGMDDHVLIPNAPNLQPQERTREAGSRADSAGSLPDS